MIPTETRDAPAITNSSNLLIEPIKKISPIATAIAPTLSDCSGLRAYDFSQRYFRLWLRFPASMIFFRILLSEINLTIRTIIAKNAIGTSECMIFS